MLLELTAPDTTASKVAAAAASAAAEATGSFMGGFSRLWGGSSLGTTAPSGDAKSVWLPLTKHLQRIAGNQVQPCKPMATFPMMDLTTRLSLEALLDRPRGAVIKMIQPRRASRRLSVLQVRAAATLGGNLVLTRDRGLESDAVTLLMAAGAEVQTASPGSKPAWQSVQSFVSASSKPAPGEVVIAVRLPACQAGGPLLVLQGMFSSQEEDVSWRSSDAHIQGAAAGRLHG